MALMRFRHVFAISALALVAGSALMPDAADASWPYQNHYDATASWWAGRAASRKVAHRMRHAVRSHRPLFISSAKKIVRHPHKHRKLIRSMRRAVHKGKKLRRRLSGVGFTDSFSGWIRRHFPRRVIVKYGREAALVCGEFGMLGYGIGKVIDDKNSNGAFRDGVGACLFGIAGTFRSHS